MCKYALRWVLILTFSNLLTIEFIMKKKVKLEALKIKSFITKLDGYDRHEVLGGAKQASYSRIIICPIDETF